MAEVKNKVTRLRLLLEVPDWFAWGETPETCAEHLLTATGEYSNPTTVLEAKWDEVRLPPDTSVTIDVPAQFPVGTEVTLIPGEAYDKHLSWDPEQMLSNERALSDDLFDTLKLVLGHAMTPAISAEVDRMEARYREARR